MKKLLAIILAGLMLISCFGVTAFADEEQAELSVIASDCKITLSWEDAGEDSYSVYWKRSSSETWKLAGTTSKHKVNIIGLSNGVSYDFKVEIGGEFSETVTAAPVEVTPAVIEYYTNGEYTEYTIKDTQAIEKLRIAYESLWFNSTYTSQGIGYPYYKITVPNGDEDVVFYVTGDGLVSSPETKNAIPTDGTDYYSIIEDIIASSGVRTGTMDMPLTASDVTNAMTYEVLSDDEVDQGILQNEQTINTLLSMYFALEDIIEPTDEEMDFFKEGFMFDYDGETYSFYVDKNNIVCFSYFGERYKITADIDYYSVLHDILYDFSDSVYYEGSKTIFDDDSEISGMATLEIGSLTYTVTDPEDLDNLRIIYESLEYNKKSTSSSLGDSYCKVTLTIDGKEAEFSVSGTNIISLGGKTFSTKYDTDYYSTLAEMAENSGKQYRGVTITHFSSESQTSTTITDDADIEYLVNLYESLSEITEPTDDIFRTRSFYTISYRDNGVEKEFSINDSNLIRSESLGDETFAVTDGTDYYGYVLSMTIQEP